MGGDWFGKMRRLHPRGPEARGLVVDRDGVVLGLDHVLVERGSNGYRVATDEALAALGRTLFPEEAGRLDRLPLVLREIARALDRGELVKAQMLGLELPLCDLDEDRLARLGRAASLGKAGFDPAEPRIPAGSGKPSGRWTREDAPQLIEVAARNGHGDEEHRRGDSNEFFDTLYAEVHALAHRLGVDETWILGLAAHESAWLYPHDRKLHNPFGVTHGGGPNVDYGSFAQAVSYWERRYGPIVRGSTSAENFVGRLHAALYNVTDPKWSEKVMNNIRSVARLLPAWRSRRGSI